MISNTNYRYLVQLGKKYHIREIAFPEGVKKLIVRREGNKLVLEPESSFWDDFFSRPPCPDFPDRAPQGQYEERESFDR